MNTNAGGPFGNELRRLRKELRPTTRAVADAMSVSRQTLYQIERGRRSASLDETWGAAMLFAVDPINGRPVELERRRSDMFVHLVLLRRVSVPTPAALRALADAIEADRPGALSRVAETREPYRASS